LGIDWHQNHETSSYPDADRTPGDDRDTLGFEVRNDVGYGGMRWITVGPADQPGTSIVLEPPAADPVGCRLVVPPVDFAPRRSS